MRLNRPRALLILLFASALPAQGTAPPGYLSTESSGERAYSCCFGGFPHSRFQITHADRTGKGSIQVNQISLRQDGTIASPTGIGRRWADLQLNMCETDLASASLTWTANYATTPTQVFSGSHVFPSLTSNPPGSPEIWNNGGLRIPFATKWVYTAKQDMLFDFRFAGGTLVNRASWGPTTQKSYYLDGRSLITTNQGRMWHFGLSARNGANRCQFDSGNIPSNTTFGVYQYWAVFTDGDTGSPTTSNKFRFWRYLFQGPKNTNVLQAVTLRGTSDVNSAPRIPALGCQPLFLDFTALLFVLGFKTDATGRFIESARSLPYNSGAAGHSLWCQGIWNDTKTGHPKMTWGSRTEIPPLPPKRDFRARMLRDFGITSPTGTPTITYIPLIRFD